MPGSVRDRVRAAVMANSVIACTVFHKLCDVELMPALIADWRKLFGQGDFPFYIVSLPAHQQRKEVPGEIRGLR
jgi:hypothetical protein